MWYFYSHSSLPFLAPNSTCNVHNAFECGNGDCIDFSRTCDGVAHCKDKSDEKQSYCSKDPSLPPLLAYCLPPLPCFLTLHPR